MAAVGLGEGGAQELGPFKGFAPDGIKDSPFKGL